jgi:cytidylate kinase
MQTFIERRTNPQREVLNRNSLIMTIDGSTTAGKRVIAEHLADRYDLTVLNTGTSIRAMALLSIENGLVNTNDTNVTMIPSDFADKVVELYDRMPEKLTITKPRDGEHTARVMVGSRDMRGELLAYEKQKAIDNLSAVIAASPVIRWKLYQLWRKAAEELGGTIVIGRKTGIDLFPNAPVKMYFFASPEASAAYRVTHDPTATMHQTTEELYIRERDGQDQGNGLLDRPAGAMVIDTSNYISRSDGKGLAELEAQIAKTIDARFEIK